MFRHQIRPLETHRNHFVELLIGTGENIGTIRQSRIINEDIDTAETRDDFLHHLLHVTCFGDVAEHKHGFVAAVFELLDHRLAAAFMHLYDRNFRSLIGE